MGVAVSSTSMRYGIRAHAYCTCSKGLLESTCTVRTREWKQLPKMAGFSSYRNNLINLGVAT